MTGIPTHRGTQVESTQKLARQIEGDHAAIEIHLLNSTYSKMHELVGLRQQPAEFGTQACNDCRSNFVALFPL